MQAADGTEAGRTGEFAELKRQLDAADASIVLVNKRLDEAQSMYFLAINRYLRGALC